MLLYRLAKWAEAQERAGAQAGDSGADHPTAWAGADGMFAMASGSDGDGGATSAVELDASPSLSDGADFRKGAAPFERSADAADAAQRGEFPRSNTDALYDRSYVSGLGAAFDRAAVQAMPWLFKQTDDVETKNGDRL